MLNRLEKKLLTVIQFNSTNGISLEEIKNIFNAAEKWKIILALENLEKQGLIEAITFVNGSKDFKVVEEGEIYLEGNLLTA